MENKVHYYNIETELSFLRKEAAILLGQIQIHEDYIYYLKDQLRVDQEEIDKMKEMILKFFRLLALIDAFQFFESRNMVITDQNKDIFKLVYEQSHSTRTNKFLNDLNTIIGNLTANLFNNVL